MVGGLLVLVLLPSASSGQTTSESISQGSFLAAARDAATRFEDRDEAIRSGYRRVGPDFPGMGEHWVHPARIVRGFLDPTEPPVLSYVEREGRPVLVGVAYAVPLLPGEDPPDGPFDPEAWHDHSASVDEETLLINSPSSMHGGREGPRLSMVHVWTGLENPRGILEQNNWALPFWRLGLPVPDPLSENAARGLSLAGAGRTFYRELIRRAAAPSAKELTELERLLDEYSRRIEDAAALQMTTPRTTVDQAVFEALWRDFWEEVQQVLSEQEWAPLAGFAGD